MEELRSLGRSGPIADFVARPPFSLPMEVVSGVSLRFDPYWLSSYSFYNFRYPYPYTMAHVPQLRTFRVHGGYRYDMSYRPNDWSDYCASKGLRGDSQPVQVIVILRKELPDGIPESWPRYVDDGYPIVYEYRPEAVLQALAPGDSVSGLSNGTLGGYLWNPTDGRHFAISCAHVFGSAPTYSTSASSISAGGVVVGKVLESHMPSASTAKCNSHAQSGTPSVDVAVADLSGGPSIHLPTPSVGKVTLRSQIASLGPGDVVSLTGATSGTVHGTITACNLWKEITFAGATYCFSDLLEVTDATHHYFASSFTRPGDSGAWVVNNSAGHAAWDAMLIGGGGAIAYCAYAENIALAIDPSLALP